VTPKEAKKELWRLKDMERDLKCIRDEIERIMTVATKMTPGYDITPVSGTPKNKIEEALVKVDEYKSRLSRKMIEEVDYCMMCQDKVDKIETRTLRTIINYYFFQDKTLEQTAELLGKSYQWTYELYKTALEKYAEISST